MDIPLLAILFLGVGLIFFLIGWNSIFYFAKYGGFKKETTAPYQIIAKPRYKKKIRLYLPSSFIFLNSGVFVWLSEKDIAIGISIVLILCIFVPYATYVRNLSTEPGKPAPLPPRAVIKKK